MTFVRLSAVTMTAAMTLLLIACAEEENPNPSTRTPSNADAGQLSGLSQAYSDNCARCHGARGEGDSKYPRIPGTKDEAGYIASVRAGSSDQEMSPFDSSAITDADLKADFLWLTTKRQ